MIILWRVLFGASLVLANRAEAFCTWKPGELIRITGDVQQGDLRGTFSRSLALASGRFSEQVDLGILKSGSGFDGRLAWSQDVSGASHYLNSDFARRLSVSEAWVSANVSCPPPIRSSRATHVGKDASSGLDVWRLTPPRGAPIELWYNRNSGRLERAMLRYSENTLIHHYADWREVAPGKLLPFIQRDEDPEDESETTYEVRHIEKLTNASFTPALRPNDAKIELASSTTIPFEDDGRRRIYLPVYLDGKGPFEFELDNGGHFILTEATADALGLHPQGSFASTGAGNQVHHAGYVAVASLRVGNAEVVNQTAKVLPLSNNDRGNLRPRAGILGLEFFERFIVAIDHRNKTVTLRLISDSTEGHKGHLIPLLFDEDAALVQGGYENATGNVMLDIGNASPTIVEDYWASQHGLRGKLAIGAPRGSAKLSRGAISIGPFRLANETVAYLGPAERGSEYTRSVAAIIGEPLLSRFNAVYDYGHETVWLDLLPDVPPLPFEKSHQ